MKTDTNRIQGVKGSGGKVLKPFITKERWTILRILKEVEEVLRSEGIPNPRYDAEALLSKALNLDRVGLYSEYNRTLTEEEVHSFMGLVKRRKRREPLQYIFGSAEFYGLEFLVTPDVLIPRPETELLIEETLKQFTDNGSQFTVLDLCTGSGCIAVTLAKQLKDAKIFAVDISAKTLKVAKENARRHGVESRTDFIQGDLFEPFSPSPESSPPRERKNKDRSSPLRGEGWVRGFDLIVSNPPYIPGDEIDLLQREVKDYELREALDGGPDGLFYIKKIIEDAPGYLKAGGCLLLEIGYGQKEGVCESAEERGRYLRPEVVKDFAGIERVVKWIRS
ncbi:MAG: peptide chain release factor N(5)-glutamine methyltransferase [Nitrospirota bacterium]